MQLHEVTLRLKGVRRGGRGIAAKCPAHDDSRQSLSVCESDGRILLKCFAGCSTQTIVNKLGLTWNDLFDKRIEKPKTSNLGESINPTVQRSRDGGMVYFAKSQGHIHDIYPYIDEHGEVLYENVRYYPKGFRQRRTDKFGNPIYNLEGVRRVPYRLPELIAAKEQQSDVFLCEGEKDADALRELGFTATSFKNWREDFNQYIQGLHVIVCQDHDQPGVTMATEAAKILLRSASSVKILDMYADRELPENHGLDISDYIRWCVEAEAADADTLKERICVTIDNTPNWKEKGVVQSKDYFRLKSTDERMAESRDLPTPRKLFGDFWYEGEVCVLFADTNVGKSILAVQIGNAIANGIDPDKDGHLKNNTPAQKIVYFDFELSAVQFGIRFSETDPETGKAFNPFVFGPNMITADINPETADIGEFKNFEEFLNNALETAVSTSGAKVLIIDNITYLRDETENARNALPMMKYLKALKSKYGLSILVLAHTPKRDSGKPLGRNDLQGSKMIINFCDSAFAIGESAKQVGTRYLKQIKARNTEQIYNEENVLLATIRKEVNFLSFHFAETANERDHLKVINDKMREELKARAVELSASGMSNKKIAQELGVTAMTVGRYLKGNVTSEGVTAVTPDKTMELKE